MRSSIYSIYTFNPGQQCFETAAEPVFCSPEHSDVDLAKVVYSIGTVDKLFVKARQNPICLLDGHSFALHHSPKLPSRHTAMKHEKPRICKWSLPHGPDLEVVQLPNRP